MPRPAAIVNGDIGELPFGHLPLDTGVPALGSHFHIRRDGCIACPGDLGIAVYFVPNCDRYMKGDFLYANRGQPAAGHDRCGVSAGRAIARIADSMAGG